VVIAAFSLLFVAEFLVLLNYATNRAYVTVLCPVGNICHILAVILFGFVYFREMSLEKDEAQRALSTYRDHLEHLVSIRTAELTEANKQLEKAAVLQERQRIAADMHDGLAQTLSYLGMRTDSAEELLRDGHLEQVMGEFDTMQDAIGQATLDVRRSIASLQASPGPRQTLQEALTLLVNNHLSNGGPDIESRFHLSGNIYLAAGELDQVSKVIQEALLNVKNHAQASRVVLQITTDGDSVQIAVTDDGRGFDPAQKEKMTDDHFGLSIMKARASRIGGRLTINSRAGQGAEVVLTWRPQKERSPARSQDVHRHADGEPTTLVTV
jgi:signal transduction histidine kinase